MSDAEQPRAGHEDLTVSDWICALRQGDPGAATRLWERVEERLRSLARRRLRGAPTATYDDEDLANSALNALCLGAREGRFDRLESREDLWKLLTTILSRKAANRHRYHGVRDELGESAVGAAEQGLDGFAGVREEDWVDALTLHGQELVDGLEPKLQEVALLKFQGLTSAEISERIGRAPRTVQRYMDLIRAHWSEQDPA